MSTMQERFKTATAEVQQLSERPSNDDLLRLYSLFKQATEGDVSGKRPGFFDPVGRAKHGAWAALEGTSAEDAMSGYADLVAHLRDE